MRALKRNTTASFPARPGRLVSAKNAQGDDMPFQYDQYVQAQDGYDLVLTIDETAQSIVEKHLQAGLEAAARWRAARPF